MALLMRRNLLAVACLLALALQPVFAATRTITDKANGSTIHIHPGDQLVLRLRSNATTGYSWSLLPDSTPLLALQHKEYEGPAMPIAGAGGTQVLTFHADKKGKGDLLLHYTRSWEKPRPHEQQFVVHIDVQ